jgi:hypothetical protein
MTPSLFLSQLDKPQILIRTTHATYTITFISSLHRRFERFMSPKDSPVKLLRNQIDENAQDLSLVPQANFANSSTVKLGSNGSHPKKKKKKKKKKSRCKYYRPSIYTSENCGTRSKSDSSREHHQSSYSPSFPALYILFLMPVDRPRTSHWSDAARGTYRWSRGRQD